MQHGALHRALALVRGSRHLHAALPFVAIIVHAGPTAPRDEGDADAQRDSIEQSDSPHRAVGVRWMPTRRVPRLSAT